MRRLIFAALLCPLPALAFGAYPEKSIRLVVPFPPGSIMDVAARALAQGMTGELHQPIVVENRAGANWIVGTASAARSDPDGHTSYGSAWRLQPQRLRM